MDTEIPAMFAPMLTSGNQNENEEWGNSVNPF